MRVCVYVGGSVDRLVCVPVMGVLCVCVCVILTSMLSSNIIVYLHILGNTVLDLS